MKVRLLRVLRDARAGGAERGEKTLRFVVLAPRRGSAEKHERAAGAHPCGDGAAGFAAHMRVGDVEHAIPRETLRAELLGQRVRRVAAERERGVGAAFFEHEAAERGVFALRGPEVSGATVEHGDFGLRGLSGKERVLHGGEPVGGGADGFHRGHIAAVVERPLPARPARAEAVKPQRPRAAHHARHHRQLHPARLAEAAGEKHERARDPGAAAGGAIQIAGPKIHRLRHAEMPRPAVAVFRHLHREVPGGGFRKGIERRAHAAGIDVGEARRLVPRDLAHELPHPHPTGQRRMLPKVHTPIRDGFFPRRLCLARLEKADAVERSRAQLRWSHAFFSEPLAKAFVPRVGAQRFKSNGLRLVPQLHEQWLAALVAGDTAPFVENFLHRLPRLFHRIVAVVERDAQRLRLRVQRPHRGIAARRWREAGRAQPRVIRQSDALRNVRVIRRRATVQRGQEVVRRPIADEPEAPQLHRLRWQIRKHRPLRRALLLRRANPPRPFHQRTLRRRHDRHRHAALDLDRQRAPNRRRIRRIRKLQHRPHTIRRPAVPRRAGRSERRSPARGLKPHRQQPRRRTNGERRNIVDVRRRDLVRRRRHIRRRARLRV